MKRNAPLLLAAVTLALTGCASSPPTQFYSLTAVPPQSGAAQSDSAQASLAAVRVAAVHIPPDLDRRGIVRTAPGDRLDVSGIQRWGAPFDEMVQQVLTQDLVQRLPPDKVVLPTAPAPSSADAIVVNLLQFQSDEAGKVLLQGTWSLLKSGRSSPALIREFDYDESASPPGFGNEAGAMSRLLGRLADDIAREVAAQR